MAPIQLMPPVSLIAPMYLMAPIWNRASNQNKHRTHGTHLKHNWRHPCNWWHPFETGHPFKTNTLNPWYQFQTQLTASIANSTYYLWIYIPCVTWLITFVWQVIKSKGLEQISVEDLVSEITPRGRATIPDDIKADLLERIRKFLASN